MYDGVGVACGDDVSLVWQLTYRRSNSRTCDYLPKVSIANFEDRTSIKLLYGTMTMNAKCTKTLNPKRFHSFGTSFSRLNLFK